MEARCLVSQSSVSRFQGPLPLWPRLLCAGGARVEGCGGKALDARAPGSRASSEQSTQDGIPGCPWDQGNRPSA